METPGEGKAEKLLKDLGKRLDAFATEAKQASTRVESDLRAKYNELKASAEKLRNEAKDKDRWKEVEAALKRAGDELEKAAKEAFKKRG